MKLKVRVYALFQFFSILTILTFVGSIFLASINATHGDDLLSRQFWSQKIVNIIRLEELDASSIFASLLFYIGLGLLVLTWIDGWMIFLVKNRNFFDSLFLLFVMIPMVANIFCLLAQLSLNTYEYTSLELSSAELKKEKTQIIKLMNKEKRASLNRKRQKLQLAKAKKDAKKKLNKRNNQ